MVKFLVIRFSSIGDIVLTTPVIRALKTQVEHAEVYFLTKQQFVCILESNPYLTKVYSFNNNYPALIRQLKEENFDYIIDLHRNIRTLRFKSALRRMSYSIKKLNIRKWILVNFKKDILPEEHIVQRYLNTVDLFSAYNDKKGLDYFIPQKDIFKIDRLHIKTPFIVLVVGGGHHTKQIPIEKLIDICQGIDAHIVLLGGKEDREKADELVQKVTDKKLHNMVGRLNINQSASVIEQSALVIAPDTGMMHIAAALGKTVFSVWGSTVPKFGMYPYQPGEGSQIFEVKEISCRPCSKIGYPKCPKKHFKCMMLQDFEKITQQASKIVTLE